MNGKPWVPSQFFLFSVHDLCAEIIAPHVKGNPHSRGAGIALQMPIPPLDQGWVGWHEKSEEPKKVTLSHQVPLRCPPGQLCLDYSQLLFIGVEMRSARCGRKIRLGLCFFIVHCKRAASPLHILHQKRKKWFEAKPKMGRV